MFMPIQIRSRIIIGTPKYMTNAIAFNASSFDIKFIFNPPCFYFRYSIKEQFVVRVKFSGLLKINFEPHTSIERHKLKRQAADFQNPLGQV